MRSLAERAATHDVLLLAGDLATQHAGLDDVCDVIAGARAPVVITPGNNETLDDLHAAVELRCPEATVLHGEQRLVSGLSVFALGCGVPPIGKDWSFDLTETEAGESLAQAASPVDVLLLHSPPRGAADRNDAGERSGSAAIMHAVHTLEPRLAVCGHVHPAWGTVAKVGLTTVVNPGPSGITFEMDAA